jgi:hypothetical protein
MTELLTAGKIFKKIFESLQQNVEKYFHRVYNNTKQTTNSLSVLTIRVYL